MMKLKQWMLTSALAGLFAASASHAAPVIYDLTSGIEGPPLVQDTATINGAIFVAPSGSYDATGSGVFNPFVRIQNAPSEQGYNTSDRDVQFDEKTDPNFTRDLLFSSVPVVTLNNVSYLEFVLDIDENASANGRYLSLDRLQLFVGADQATNTPAGGYDLVSKLGSLTALWDLDGLADSAILLDYKVVKSGSGRADMVALIPLSVIPTSLQNASSSLYLYSQFGVTKNPYGPDGIDATSDAGYEEWAWVRGSVTCPPGSTNPDCGGGGGGGGSGGVPEPGTLSLFGAALLGSFFYSRRRRQQHG